MNFYGLALLAACLSMLFACSRKWVMLPLLIGLVYSSAAQAIDVGPFTFTVMRLLIAAGLLRALSKEELGLDRVTKIDRRMALWAAVALITSLFHEVPGSSLVGALGLVYTCLGIYFLFRLYVRDLEDIYLVTAMLVILFIPVALEMVSERITGRNVFSLLAGGGGAVVVRHGEIRACGPFAHPILAGTVGAVTLPLTFIHWWRTRWITVLGCLVCAGMVLASNSSGPILSAMAACGAVALWVVRDKVRLLVWLGVVLLILLDVWMYDPVYYLLARVDLTGSSTGWHRAELIHATITHLDEWWLFGTDHTRHWMPTGVPWSQNHTDITNHYIKMAVYGGLPLLLVFISIISAGFGEVRRALDELAQGEFAPQFVTWIVGSILFAHVVTFVSITYFDQSIGFFILILVAACAMRDADPAPAEDPRDVPPDGVIAGSE